MPKKLTRKQEQAIIALLSCDSLKEAAETCGLSKATLSRYLRDEDFQQHYRAARRQVVEQAVSRMQGLMSDAVDTLERNLRCRKPAIEVRAAQLVIEQAVKGVELIDLQERVEKLELLLNEPNKTNRRH